MSEPVGILQDGNIMTNGSDVYTKLKPVKDDGSLICCEYCLQRRWPQNGIYTCDNFIGNFTNPTEHYCSFYYPHQVRLTEIRCKSRIQRLCKIQMDELALEVSKSLKNRYELNKIKKQYQEQIKNFYKIAEQTPAPNKIAFNLAVDILDSIFNKLEEI
jgi:hypothetical protein